MKRLWKFDYIKAFCILSVIIIHSTNKEDMGFNVLFPYYILMAVPLFMIVSGYMSAMSCEHHGITKLSQSYRISNIGKKLLHIVLPYIFIYLCQWGIQSVYFHRTVGLRECIYTFFTGGWGPGGYYIPILIQITLLFPIIYTLISKHLVGGSITVILFQFILEIGIQYWQVPDSLYRLLCIRYISFVVGGILIYKYYEKITKKIMVLLGLLGFAAIWLITYADYEEHIFKYWTSTSMPTTFWAMLLVILWMKLKKPFPGILDKLIMAIGHSTYYIYLVQMLYFILRLDQMMIGTIPKTMVAITSCCVAGYLFGWLYKSILNKGAIRNG